MEHIKYFLEDNVDMIRFLIHPYVKAYEFVDYVDRFDGLGSDAPFTIRAFIEDSDIVVKSEYLYDSNVIHSSYETFMKVVEALKNNYITYFVKMEIEIIEEDEFTNYLLIKVYTSDIHSFKLYFLNDCKICN